MDQPTAIKQTAVIRGWLPPPVLNGSRQKHWSVLRREAQLGQVTAWAAAKQAGWVFMPGKVRLTITLVFGVNRRRDTDNTYARCKHVIDGLKVFFEDDSTDYLDLHVRTEIKPGMRETRFELESLVPVAEPEAERVLLD